MKLTTIKTLSITGFIALASFVLIGTGQSHAASITVATGADENTDNASCSLTEAIQNVNDQPTQTNTDCPAADGVNDTIAIPAGTIMLTADLPAIAGSVSVVGAGMKNTVIDGDGQWTTLAVSANSSDILKVSDLKITGFIRAGILASVSSLDVQRVDIDGTDSVPADGLLFGVASFVDNGDTSSFTVRDVYVHDINGAISGIAGGLGVMASHDSTVTSAISNTTITRIANTSAQTMGIVFAGGIFNDMSPATFHSTVSNSTISDLSAQTNTAAIGNLGVVSTGSGSAELTIRNVTITGMHSFLGSEFLSSSSTGILSAGGTVDGSAIQASTVNATNVLIGELTGPTLNAACLQANINTIFDGTGTVDNSFTSSGGNVVSDNSCINDFNKSTDQNNTTTLGNYLSPLADNGGFIPTIALLQGSPAIDAGVPVAGLTTDARQAIRPQGNAFDTGAYESPFTRVSRADTGENVTMIALIGMLMTILGAGIAVHKLQQI